MTDAVSTLGEFVAWLPERRNKRRIEATGELADLVRARFNAGPHMPVRLTIDYDIGSLCEVIGIECGALPSSIHGVVCFQYLGDPEGVEDIRIWLEDGSIRTRGKGQEPSVFTVDDVVAWEHARGKKDRPYVYAGGELAKQILALMKIDAPETLVRIAYVYWLPAESMRVQLDVYVPTGRARTWRHVKEYVHYCDLDEHDGVASLHRWLEKQR